MDGTVSSEKVTQFDGTPARRGLLQHSWVGQTPTAMGVGDRGPLNVTQSSVNSSSSNPFSIDRILQPGPPRTVRPWCTDIEDRSWNVTLWTAITSNSSVSDQRHPSVWSSNYTSTAGQRIGYPALNDYSTGKTTLYDVE